MWTSSIMVFEKKLSYTATIGWNVWEVELLWLQVFGQSEIYPKIRWKTPLYLKGN